VSSPYEIVLEPSARRELDKIPLLVFPKIDKAILELSKNPRPFGVKKLEEKIHRIRVGNWRVIYSILDKEARIIILRVAKRNEQTYK
jgi:mRNA interferase RelE/StbE